MSIISTEGSVQNHATFPSFVCKGGGKGWTIEKGFQKWATNGDKHKF